MHPTSQKVIVDGYNVIYADDRLRRFAIKNMERARKEFVGLLRSYVEAKRIQVTVVFDGRGSLADADAVIPGKLQVVYSPRGQTADDLIISTVRGAANPQSYLVVTSDRTHIIPVVRGLGCQVLGARRFLERIASAEPDDPRPADEKPDPISDDTDYWMDKFGDGDKS
ncbi:MAG: NYN domain-containing protein [Candidatus Latescibacterota bacterium]|nr:MAG: NYN domain-containing protein [Candidatus Latescibacterota bacterium]